MEENPWVCHSWCALHHTSKLLISYGHRVIFWSFICLPFASMTGKGAIAQTVLGRNIWINMQTPLYIYTGCLHKRFTFMSFPPPCCTYIFKIVGGKTKETQRTQSSTKEHLQWNMYTAEGHLSFIDHDANQTGRNPEPLTHWKGTRNSPFLNHLFRFVSSSYIKGIDYKQSPIISSHKSWTT